MTWLRKEVGRGVGPPVRRRPAAEITERIEYELGVIEKMGFPAYFLVVADICQYARDNKIGLGPGRGSATGCMVAYVAGITELDPIEHSPAVRAVPQPRAHQHARRRPGLRRAPARRHDPLRHREVRRRQRVARSSPSCTIKAKAAVKDSCRILGYPFAIGDQITKAFPPAVMGKEIPLAGDLRRRRTTRYSEAGELRAMYDEDPDVKKVIDTARGIEGLIRGTGVHAAGVILSSEPLVDVMPIHRRDDDGAIITGFDVPECEDMGLLKMDFLGLRNLTVIADAVENVKANRGIDLDLVKLPLDDSQTYELLARGDTLGRVPARRRRRCATCSS